MVFLGIFGVLITDELWVAIMSLAGVWLLPSPVAPTLTIKREPYVSRETSDSEADYASKWGKDNLPPLTNVSRETITAPCVVMHGSAEPHVLGCDGWTFDQE